MLHLVPKTKQKKRFGLRLQINKQKDKQCSLAEVCYAVIFKIKLFFLRNLQQIQIFMLIVSPGDLEIALTVVLTSCSFSHKRSSRSWMMSSEDGEWRREAGASLRWLSL